MCTIEYLFQRGYLQNNQIIISYDGSVSPPTTIEQIRDGLIIGTDLASLAITLNLFLATGAEWQPVNLLTRLPFREGSASRDTQALVGELAKLIGKPLIPLIRGVPISNEEEPSSIVLQDITCSLALFNLLEGELIVAQAIVKTQDILGVIALPADLPGLSPLRCRGPINKTLIRQIKKSLGQQFTFQIPGNLIQLNPLTEVNSRLLLGVYTFPSGTQTNLVAINDQLDYFS